MTIRPFQHLPTPAIFTTFSSVTEYLRKVWDAMYKLRRGKIECVTELTLTAGVAQSGNYAVCQLAVSSVPALAGVNWPVRHRGEP